ncbi:hypothetical protein Riv7116_6938 (plasmid) [Rivularia sp. PCC 7116]|uniref:hypothetical protein n=1 Tax=Rivularia sp. PCC 7116 TaxID=373994 RepID=UPI00029F27D8|nr:hypothetical protein [Rivularia sp. PCC 7116]AFY59250.1 hypothetical protein Riv7116_6938 [Rivularia sp. PCC 7116]
MSSLISPEEFFDLVTGLSSQDKVIHACIDLLESLENDLHVKVRDGLKTYETSTISKMISHYRKPFYSYVSPLSVLNETVEIREYCPHGEFAHTFKRASRKHGAKAGDTLFYNLVQKQQHVAANLLALSEQQLLELVDRRIDNWILNEETAA